MTDKIFTFNSQLLVADWESKYGYAFSGIVFGFHFLVYLSVDTAYSLGDLLQQDHKPHTHTMTY